MTKRLKQWFSSLPIRTRISIVTSTIIISAILSSAALLIFNLYQALENEQGNRVLAISRTVAQLETVKDNIVRPEGWKQIQPVAERIRLATEVDYVVVFDMNRIRYSHPIEAKIGTTFHGGDEKKALEEQEYISLAKGVQGIAVRSFVPILDKDGFEQIGVVVVGTVLPNLLQLLQENKIDLILAVTIGVMVGLLGAWFLTNSIKRQMFNLEPLEIARLLEERESLIDTIVEGIIAIDRTKKIRVINEHAARFLGVSQDVVGCLIEEIVPNSELPTVLETGKPQIHQMMVLNATVVLTNRLPIIVSGKTVGAVAIFQDRTEMIRLAEELTGIRKFSDTLRAQNHEYMNKLHTIGGLIQLERCDDALNLILSYTEEQEGLTNFLMRRIKHPSLTGLILGKISHAKELGIELILDRDSHVPELPSTLQTQDMIMVIGNLLENAIDATVEKANGKGTVYLQLNYAANVFSVVVRDNGIGIDPNLEDDIFTLGFTTKGDKGQGIGLALVKQYVESLNGSIEVKSAERTGTTFSIRLPVNND